MTKQEFEKRYWDYMQKNTVMPIPQAVKDSYKAVPCPCGKSVHNCVGWTMENINDIKGEPCKS